MTKNYCQKCLQKTNHNSLFKKEIGSKPNDDFGWSKSFEVIECSGCETIQFREIYGDEDMVYSNDGEEGEHYNEEICYPLSIENHTALKKLHWLPYKIKTIYLETLEAIKVKSYILAGVGFRAIIEAICIDKDIKGKNLQNKIDNLLKEKLITQRESNRLHSIRFLGNDSIHEMLSPEPKKLFVVLDLVEHLLNNLYLIDQDADNILETIISNYTEFEELVWYSSNKFSDEEEITIKILLGKYIRRVENENLLKFTEKLIENIENKNIDWLKINKKELKLSKIDNQKFIVKK